MKTGFRPDCCLNKCKCKCLYMRVFYFDPAVRWASAVHNNHNRLRKADCHLHSIVTCVLNASPVTDVIASVISRLHASVKLQ